MVHFPLSRYDDCTQPFVMFGTLDQPPNDVAACDRCRNGTPFSFERFALFILAFLAMMVSGFALVFLISDPVAFLMVWVVTDSAAATLYTFSQNKSGMRAFMFRCPIVQRTMPGILRCHATLVAIFLSALAIAFVLRPHLPRYWNTPASGDPNPFDVGLIFVGASVVIGQIVKYRSMLDAAHDE